MAINNRLIHDIFRDVTKSLILIIFKPPIFLSNITVYLFILSGLEDHINLNRSSFISLTKELSGFGKDVKRWFSFANRKVLTIVILPNGVRYLLFHLQISSFISIIFWTKFIFKQSSKFTEKRIPSNLKLEIASRLQLLILILCLLCFFFPIQAICVFSVLTFNPEMLPKISRVLNAACNDSILPSSIKVVSSANCVRVWFLHFQLRYLLFFYCFWS